MTVDTDTAGGEPQGDQPKKRHTVRNVIIVVIAVLVVLGGVFAGLYSTGNLYPASAAARYGTFKYLAEDDVTDYIMTYKEQMGYGEATDDEWASFLASYNLTPERLRLSTITQLLTDIALQDKCKEVGVSVSDEELDETVEGLKDAYGFADDETWADTLELYGQTEEGLRDAYELELLKQKLCAQEVATPEPTDDDVLSYIADFAASCQSDEADEAETSEDAAEIMEGDGSKLLKHSYCFKYKISGDEATLDESDQVQSIKEEFESSTMDIDTFVSFVGMYCNDDETIENDGAMGWDADTDEYSDTYIRMLETVGEGKTSSVFNDGDYVCFIWVDDTYTLPYDTDKLESLDLDAMPDSLHEYFSDCAAYQLWQEDSEEYISQLSADLPVTVYEMPSDVPYNVDMSAYEVTDEGSEESSDEDTSDDATQTETDDEGAESSSS